MVVAIAFGGGSPCGRLQSETEGSNIYTKLACKDLLRKIFSVTCAPCCIISDITCLILK